MNQTKILHTMYSGLGGHSSVVFSLINGDIKNVAEHIILFYGIEDILPEYEIKCQQLGLNYTFVKKRKGIDIKSWYKSILFMFATKPNVVIINSTNLILMGLVYKLFHKSQLLVVEHTPNSIKTKVDNLKSFLSFLIAKKIISLSIEYKNQLQDKFGKYITNKKLLIIPNGINTTTYIDRAPKKAETIKIGTHLRLSPSKDLDTIFRALTILDTTHAVDYIFYIAGDGTERHRLEQLCAKLRIENHVRFLGMLNEQSIVSFLQELDIYVMSSHADTMSTSVMQAMSCGLPIIGSNISGINNLINHKENGLLFTPKNEHDLLQFLLHLISDEKDRNRLGKNARLYAEKKLSHLKMFDRYYQTISEEKNHQNDNIKRSSS